MRRGTSPRDLAKLVQIQRSRRAAAEAALTDARAAEADARSRERLAVDEAAVAQEDWFGSIEKTGFSPEFARTLAMRLVEREEALEEAREDHRLASDNHLHRQQDWRMAEALVRLTEAGLARARRDAARNLAEKRLAEVSDRITHAWTRP